MREKNTLALGTIRMLKSAIKNAAIEKGGADAETMAAHAGCDGQ
ncbi:MAG: GatB/YqeY domain-containing protein, partial [Verrucomicrobiales bacterium]|nr:GatB/YqeY domain-containing protein [Verrucomicrobiales bacterium]